MEDSTFFLYNKSMKERQEIYDYVKNKYTTEVDFPFSKDPFTAVLRHKRNKKWYGIIMEVKKSVLGFDDQQIVDILNVKCYPEIIGELRLSKGFYPAYHMNKEHWLTILLDDCVDMKQIKELIDISYELTKK